MAASPTSPLKKERRFSRPRRVPPFAVTDTMISVYCEQCSRFHVDHTPVTIGDVFRWRCSECGTNNRFVVPEAIERKEAA